MARHGGRNFQHNEGDDEELANSIPGQDTGMDDDDTDSNRRTCPPADARVKISNFCGSLFSHCPPLISDNAQKIAAAALPIVVGLATRTFTGAIVTIAGEALIYLSCCNERTRCIDMDEGKPQFRRPGYSPSVGNSDEF